MLKCRKSHRTEKKQTQTASTPKITASQTRNSSVPSSRTCPSTTTVVSSYSSRSEHLLRPLMMPASSTWQPEFFSHTVQSVQAQYQILSTAVASIQRQVKILSEVKRVHETTGNRPSQTSAVSTQASSPASPRLLSWPQLITPCPSFGNIALTSKIHRSLQSTRSSLEIEFKDSRQSVSKRASHTSSTAPRGRPHPLNAPLKADHVLFSRSTTPNRNSTM